MLISIEDELKNIQSIENLIQSKAQSDIFTPRTLYTFSFNELKPLFELLDNYKEILGSFRKQAISMEINYRRIQMKKKRATCLDDVHDADIGYLDDGEVYDGIHFTKPVLVYNFDYGENIVEFIYRTGEHTQRELSEFCRSWWFIEVI